MNQALEKDYFEIRKFITEYKCEPQQDEFRMMFKHSITIELPREINITPDLTASDFEIIPLPNYSPDKRRFLAVRYSALNSPFFDLTPCNHGCPH